METGKFKGHAALLAANIIWGLNAPICKSILWSSDNSSGISPFALSAYRMIGACLLFWTASIFTKREHVPPKDILMLLLASVFGIQLNQMLFLWGLSLSSPINTSIIATIVPVLTMVLATLFLREPITWLKTSGVILGAAGAVILVLAGNIGGSHTGHIMGDILCIVSAISYAIYLTAFKNTVVKYSPITSMKWMFLFAAIAASAIYYKPMAEINYTTLSTGTITGIGYVVLLSTFTAYLLTPIAQKHLRPTLVSMYNYVQPLVAVLFTVVVGLDVFGFTKAAAALCIFIGVWLVTQSKSRAQIEANRAGQRGL